MRLTAELINSSLSYINPLKERELDLRGHKIPTIENLGVARDQDTIDFTDNDITILGNFPLSPRLHTLLCARNRIHSIQSNIAKSVPFLTTLVLTQNNIADFAELEPLKDLTKLTHVSLIDNPVSTKPNYRYWMLHLAPQIRFLDFKKVRDAEREQAKELFGTAKEPNEEAKRILATKSKTGQVSDARMTNGAGLTKMKLTDKDKKKIEALIRNAKSLAEVRKLEQDLREGRMPAGVDFDAMDET